MTATIVKFWRALWTPSDKKEKSALASRKFFALMFATAIVQVIVYVFVAALVIRDSGIVVKALDVIQNVTIAYFGVNLLEHGIEKWTGPVTGSGGDVV